MTDPTKPGPDADRIADRRPPNCRFRLQDEGKPYPRSACTGCGATITTGLGTYCTRLRNVPSPAPSPEPQDVRGLLERCRTILGNMALENEGGGIFTARWPVHHEPLRSDAKNLLPLIDAALAQSDAQPIERARYHLQAADHALHDVEGDRFADYAHTLVHEAAFFITDEPELQALRKIPAQSDAQPAQISRVLDRLRFCEDCLRAGVPDEYFGWSGDQPSLGELAQSDAQPVGKPVYCLGWHTVEELRKHGELDTRHVTFIAASDLIRTAPPRPDASGLIEAERERLAQMIEQYALEREPGTERVVLYFAANDIRRGRRLTDAERIENLAKAMEPEYQETADYIRARAADRSAK